MFTTLGLLQLAGAPSSGADEVQTLTINATSGNYTCTFDGQETVPLAFDAEASAVQAALVALSTVGSDPVTGVSNVLVTGSAGGPYTITFRGSLAGQNVSAITTDDTNLAGGAGTAVITTQTAGAKGTFRGAPTGQLLFDSTARLFYRNNGTPRTPVWTEWDGMT